MAKHIHMSAASISLVGFLLRGFWMWRESPLLHAKLTKILPHIIDTVLLSAAIYMLVVSQVNPFQVSWLSTKIFLLVVYIVLGMFALKRGKTKSARMIALLTSIVAILCIFAVAMYRPEIMIM
ncbi:SirB2 family protein [Aliikangiella maris]|uniref:SirB2 family protein n=2 Tax=Aliikangiella maris TaxID=3162458 RepID=A0ABV2BUN3_9GAMM